MPRTGMRNKSQDSKFIHQIQGSSIRLIPNKNKIITSLLFTTSIVLRAYNIQRLLRMSRFGWKMSIIYRRLYLMNGTNSLNLPIITYRHPSNVIANSLRTTIDQSKEIRLFFHFKILFKKVIMTSKVKRSFKVISEISIVNILLKRLSLQPIIIIHLPCKRTSLKRR